MNKEEIKELVLVAALKSAYELVGKSLIITPLLPFREIAIRDSYIKLTDFCEYLNKVTEALKITGNNN